MISNLDAIATRIRNDLEARNSARDKALADTRELIRYCSLAIRALHRAELTAARDLLAAAWEKVQTLERDLSPYPDLYFTGYVQDALKEYAEARTVMAMIQGQPLPEPEELHTPYPAYLNGLGEAVGELRRYILDALRRGDTDRCEALLQAMDDIYTTLAIIDYPDAITGNLRRTTDSVRSALEKTRGDLTYSLQQRELEAALARFAERILAQGSQQARHGSAGDTSQRDK